jgi:hypothetical protein
MKENITFNVCYLTPVFKDIAEVIYRGLLGLGFTTYFNQSTIIVNAKNIIFGSHLITDHNIIPSDSIIFNLEQLGSDSQYCNNMYFDTLKTYQVWDYSQRNIAWLNQNNDSTAQLIPIGYSPEIYRIPKPEIQDIDILFYGAINERRSKILDELRSAGLNVLNLIGVYGDELDSYISRSKVILNLHFHETNIFEVVRVSYLLNNKKAVVSEVGVDTEIEADLREAVIGVKYDKLVTACIKVVQDDALRLMIEENAYTIFSARPQSNLLKEAVFSQYIAIDKLPNTNTLIIGDSHGYCMAKHLGEYMAKWEDVINAPIPIISIDGCHIADFILLNEKLNFFSLWLQEGIVHAEIASNFSETLKTYNNKETVCFLINHGNEHNVRFMCQHIQPFDFFDSSISDKLISGRQIISRSVIYKQLEVVKPMIEAEMQALKSYIPDANIFFVAPPPPIPSENHIRKFPEIYNFNINILEEKWLRLKIYKLYLELLTIICGEFDIKFLPPPSECIDECGFLKEIFWAGCTHASPDYYDFVIQSASRELVI